MGAAVALIANAPWFDLAMLHRLRRQRLRFFSALAVGCGLAVVAPLLLLALSLPSVWVAPVYLGSCLTAAALGYAAVRFAFGRKWDSEASRANRVAYVRSGSRRRELADVGL